MEYKWTVLTVTTVGQFMAALDASIIVVGLPTIIEDLNTSLFAGIWVITGYRLMITVLLVLVGRVADTTGKVKLYNVGFAVFTIGSVFSALSPTAELLVAGRLIQGLGAAFLIVNSMAILVDTFPSDELGTAISANQMATNAAQIIGYSLSGIMIGLLGWRSLFWVNIPIGIFGTIWSYRRLKEIYGVTEEKVDYVGGALFATSLTLALVGLTLKGLISQALFVVSAIFFVLFLIHETRVEHPVLDLRLFRIRLFTASCVSNMCNSLAFAAVSFELTLYFQLVRGYTAFDTGIALTPIALTLILIGPISGWLSDKYGARGLSTLGLAVTTIGLLICSTFSAETNIATVTAALIVVGLGVGLFKSPNASSAMSSLPLNRRGIGAAVRSTILNSSNVISIPLALTLMTTVMPYAKLSVVVNSTTLSNSDEILQLLGAIKYAFFSSAFISGLGILASSMRGPKKPGMGLRT